MDTNAAIGATLIALCVGALALTLLTHASAHWMLSQRPSRDGPRPPISILKPLAGVDDGLFDNLASLARQDYPQFELILGAQSADDPALVVARRLQAAFPHVPIRVVSGARTLGRNPKVNNLASIAARARFELLLISDSNVRAEPSYLASLASELRDPSVGLVANVVAGTGEQTLGALFENLHLCSFVAGSICAARVIASHPCVVGKSMLFRRSDLEAVGGWRSLRNVLAEDYTLGQSMRRHGRRVVISPNVLLTYNERWGIRRFIGRHIRWGQMRRRIAPVAFFLEPLLNPIPLLTALIASADTPRTALFGLLGIALKVVSDSLLARRVRGVGFSPTDIALIPFKDALVLFIWLVASVRRTVVWRGNVLRVGPRGRLVRVRAGSLMRRFRPAKETA
jgi:ceramide glucosyltransferase